MKSKEEIEQLGLDRCDTWGEHCAFVEGYTLCQEDMELSDWDVTLTDGLEEEEWDTKPAQSPKDKAEDLFVTYYQRFPDSIYSNEGAKAEAKYCALIAVNECIELHFNLNGDTNGIGESFKFWHEVKQEIDKL
jgi:hypothetical protein